MIWGVCGVKLCKNVQFTKKSNFLSVREENCSGNQCEMFTLLLRKSVNGPFISFRIVSVKLTRLLARFLSMADSRSGCQLRFISLFIVLLPVIVGNNCRHLFQMLSLSHC